MKKKTNYTRRDFVIGGAVALGSLAISGCDKKTINAPTYGNILRVADNFTYIAHRTLLPGQSLAREYTLADIKSYPATGTIDPSASTQEKPSETYGKLKANSFKDWRLTIEGCVEKPGSYSLLDLKKLPLKKQITRNTCEEGWTGIAQWTGVQLSRLLVSVGIMPKACCVCFYAYDDYFESLDMLDALHPQTLLAYGMNGKDLMIAHGAPLRLRVEKQIGYKSVKFLNRIVVKDVFDDGGDKGAIKAGWAWYTGI
jgi:hypothetical protein